MNDDEAKIMRMCAMQDKGVRQVGGGYVLCGVAVSITAVHTLRDRGFLTRQARIGFVHYVTTKKGRAALAKLPPLVVK